MMTVNLNDDNGHAYAICYNILQKDGQIPKDMYIIFNFMKIYAAGDIFLSILFYIFH